MPRINPEEGKSKRAQKQKDAERHRLEAALERGLEEIFPTPDGVAVTKPHGRAMPLRVLELVRS